MTFNQQVAKFVSDNLDRTADRYEQIWSIKSALLAHGYQALATDRETIDAVLDVLFEEYNFPA
jgi:hypothetical protein